MKITQKGQVTIPKSLRDRYGLGHNSEVAFRAVREGVLIYPAASTTLEGRWEALKRVRGIADTGRSTDEILRITRSESE